MNSTINIERLNTYSWGCSYSQLEHSQYKLTWIKFLIKIRVRQYMTFCHFFVAAKMLKSIKRIKPKDKSSISRPVRMLVSIYLKLSFCHQTSWLIKVSNENIAELSLVFPFSYFYMKESETPKVCYLIH